MYILRGLSSDVWPLKRIELLYLSDLSPSMVSSCQHLLPWAPELPDISSLLDTAICHREILVPCAFCKWVKLTLNLTIFWIIWGELWYLWWEGTVWWLPIPPHTRLNTQDWGSEVVNIKIPNLMRAQVHSHLGLELQRRHYETSVKGWILTDTIEATVFLMIPFLFLCAPASDQIQHGILSSPCTPAQPWCHR